MIKIGNKIKNIIERDKRVIMPTTREVFPFVPSHGKNDIVYDIEGNKFIDFSSFISVYNFGIGNEYIVNAIREQANKLIHAAFTDFYGVEQVEFAEKLIKFMPNGFGKVFFSNSGTEANEAAIKFARLLNKRYYIIGFYNAFHGRTYGSLSLTASKAIQRAHLGPFVGSIHVPYPYPYRFKYGDEDECTNYVIDFIEENIINKEYSSDEIAAIMFEPIQGEGGYIVPPKNFFRELRKIADKYGILLIDDEVQAGYMRTGKFLALDNFNTKADIYTFGKSAGGGVPIGITVTSNKLGTIPEGSHANTFGGNYLAIAGANATIDYINKNRFTLEREIKKKGEIIIKRLLEMQNKYELIGDVRGIGLMIGIELVKNKYTKEYAVKERDEVIKNAFYDGLLLLPAGKSSIRIIPPLTVSYENIEKGLEILENSIKKVNFKLK